MSGSSGKQAPPLRGPFEGLPEGSLKVLQLTDCHLYADPSQCLLGLNTINTLDQVIALAAIDPLLLLSMNLEAALSDESPAPSIFRIESGLYDDGDKATARFVVVGVVDPNDGEAGEPVDRRLDELPCDRVFLSHSGWRGHIEGGRA